MEYSVSRHSHSPLRFLCCNVTRRQEAQPSNQGSRVVNINYGWGDANLILNSTGDNQVPVRVVFQRQQIHTKAMVRPLNSECPSFASSPKTVHLRLMQHRFLFRPHSISPLLTVVHPLLALQCHSHHTSLIVPTVMLLLSNLLTVFLGHNRSDSNRALL